MAGVLFMGVAVNISPTHLLAEYGYLAVFVGSVLEGETILILAGFAAHQGYLSFPLAVLLGFLGGSLGDQAFFFLGHGYGQAILARFPKAGEQVDRVHRLIRRYNSLVIVLVRFLYGLRVAGPVIIGMSGIGAWRFIFFNLLGAALWAFLVCGAGYVFGRAMTLVFEDAKRYEELALVLMVAAAAGLSLWHWWRRRKAARSR